VGAVGESKGGVGVLHILIGRKGGDNLGEDQKDQRKRLNEEREPRVRIRILGERHMEGVAPTQNEGRSFSETRARRRRKSAKKGRCKGGKKKTSTS